MCTDVNWRCGRTGVGQRRLHAEFVAHMQMPSLHFTSAAAESKSFAQGISKKEEPTTEGLPGGKEYNPAPHPSKQLSEQESSYLLMHPVYSKDYVESIKPKHRPPQTVRTTSANRMLQNKSISTVLVCSGTLTIGPPWHCVTWSWFAPQCPIKEVARTLGDDDLYHRSRRCVHHRGHSSRGLLAQSFHHTNMPHQQPRAHRGLLQFLDYLSYYSIQTVRTSFDLITGYHPDRMNREKWLTRIVFLETVAGVPGMMGAMIRHLHSLRLMRRDHGWIHTLLEEVRPPRLPAPLLPHPSSSGTCTTHCRHL